MRIRLDLNKPSLSLRAEDAAGERGRTPCVNGPLSAKPLQLAVLRRSAHPRETPSAPARGLVRSDAVRCAQEMNNCLERQRLLQLVVSSCLLGWNSLSGLHFDPPDVTQVMLFALECTLGPKAEVPNAGRMDELPPSPRTPVSSTAGSFLSFLPDGPLTPHQRGFSRLDSAHETPKAARRKQEAPPAFSLEVSARQPLLDLHPPPYPRNLRRSPSKTAESDESARSASDSEDVFSDASYGTTRSGDSFASRDPFADRHARRTFHLSSSTRSVDDRSCPEQVSKLRDCQPPALAPSFFYAGGGELVSAAFDIGDSDSISSAWEDELYASLSESEASIGHADRVEAPDLASMGSGLGSAAFSSPASALSKSRLSSKPIAPTSPRRSPCYSSRRRRQVNLDPPNTRLPVSDRSPPLSAFHCGTTSPIGLPVFAKANRTASRTSPPGKASLSSHRLPSPRTRGSPLKSPKRRRPRKVLAPINTDELDRFFGVSSTRRRQLDDAQPCRPHPTFHLSSQVAEAAISASAISRAAAVATSEETHLLGMPSDEHDAASGRSADLRQRLRRPPPLQLSSGCTEPSTTSRTTRELLSPVWSTFTASDDGSDCGDIDDSSSCLDAEIEFAAPIFVCSERCTPRAVPRAFTAADMPAGGSSPSECEVEPTDLPPSSASQHGLPPKRGVAQRLRNLYEDLF